MKAWAAALALLAAGCAVEREDLPWTPLDLEAPVGMSTGMKLAALREDPPQCAALIAQTPALVTAPLGIEPARPECDLAGAVLLERSTIPYGDPVRVSCPLVAALYVWEREVAQPAAQATLGAEIARVEHYGTYSCRRIGGGSEGRFSEHARANAIDVAGFVLSDGRRISVADDYGEATPEGRFLVALRDGSCQLFRGVLGPEYNSAHADHFHFDMGPYRICR